MAIAWIFTLITATVLFYIFIKATQTYHVS